MSGEERISLAEYARRRKVSKAAVTKAVQAGRITPRVDEKGKRYLIEAEANAQWEQNSDAEMKAVGEGKSPFEDDGPEITFDDGGGPDDDAEFIQVRPVNGAIPKLNESRAKREFYAAEQERLEFEELEGKLVRADEVQKKWASIVGIARTKVLGIPSKARQRIPEMTNEQYAVLEAITREALEELADGDA